MEEVACACASPTSALGGLRGWGGRKQDRQYFEEMRLGLDEQGGAAHLLRYLMATHQQDVTWPQYGRLTAQKSHP